MVESLNSVDESVETEEQKKTRKFEIGKIEKAISENEIKLIALRKRVKEIQAEAKNLKNKTDAVLVKTNEANAKKLCSYRKSRNV